MGEDGLFVSPYDASIRIRVPSNEQEERPEPACGQYEQARDLPKTLDEACEYVEVDAPGVWSNDTGPKGWWAVSTADDGILAYFAYQSDAWRFRMDLINLLLNPLEAQRVGAKRTQ